MENETLDGRVTDVAGFSVGEFAAFVLAEMFSFSDGESFTYFTLLLYLHACLVLVYICAVCKNA